MSTPKKDDEVERGTMDEDEPPTVRREELDRSSPESELIGGTTKGAVIGGWLGGGGGAVLGGLLGLTGFALRDGRRNRSGR